METLLFNWESRPAVVFDAGESYAGGFVIRTGSSAWEHASIAEIFDSGRPMSPEAFASAFGELPPYPAPNYPPNPSHSGPIDEST